MSYGYDSNGNLTSDGSYTFTYDVENRMVATGGGSTSATLRYDPLARLYDVNGSATGTTGSSMTAAILSRNTTTAATCCGVMRRGGRDLC
ncbi:hypothetical protein [Qipengyuania sediminis]|uniref:hypothetical protein n=1 Tax=Qipengyuania sediminis TaxID=1532023 RepID=UPI00105A1F7A|nr:hypothetical protein [Qipengyuania sediminis]